MQTKKAISIPCPFWSWSALSPLLLSLLFATVHFATFRAYPYTIITCSPSTYHFYHHLLAGEHIYQEWFKSHPHPSTPSIEHLTRLGSYTSENKTAHSTMSERVSVASLVIGAILTCDPTLPLEILGLVLFSQRHDSCKARCWPPCLVTVCASLRIDIGKEDASRVCVDRWTICTKMVLLENNQMNETLQSSMYLSY